MHFDYNIQWYNRNRNTSRKSCRKNDDAILFFDLEDHESS
jgi:hypothetical protein